MNNPLTRYSAALILWMAWIMAWQQIFYSGHLPGDSFTASVLLLIAIMLQFVILGRRQGAERLRIRVFIHLLLAGLLLLITTAGAPLLAGKKMLEPLKFHLAGKTLSTTLLFELAVFLIVVGVVTYALVTFKEPEA